MRAVIVVTLDKFFEPALLPQKIAAGWLSRLHPYDYTLSRASEGLPKYLIV
jgi:hypothetical protein